MRPAFGSFCLKRSGTLPGRRWSNSPGCSGPGRACRPSRPESRCGPWAGCGQHVKQVLAVVPASQRCACRASDLASGGPAASGGAWLRRILGKNIRSLWAE